MNPRHILAALYTGFLVFFLLNLFYGDRGIQSVGELYLQEQKMLRNLSDLEMNTRTLVNELEDLKGSPELIRLRARSLGYFRAGEKVIFIPGVTLLETRRTAGEVIYRNPEGLRYDPLFRALAFIASVFILFILTVGDRLKSGQYGTESEKPQQSA